MWAIEAPVVGLFLTEVTVVGGGSV